MHFLVKPHVRKDGLFELRRVEVEGSYLPSSRDNVSFFDLDKPFQEEYLSRPMKKVKARDTIFVVPAFKKYQVVGGVEDGTGLSLVSERMESLVVAFDEVRVLQSFALRSGGVTKILLLPDRSVVD